MGVLSGGFVGVSVSEGNAVRREKKKINRGTEDQADWFQGNEGIGKCHSK
jgi:hypothetical protein